MASLFKKRLALKFEFLTDYDMILMIEKGIRVEVAKEHIDMLKQIRNI